MRVRFLDAAQRELDDAVAWYNQREAGSFLSRLNAYGNKRRNCRRWFGGTREKNPDVGIWISRHDRKGWSGVIEVASGLQENGERFPCWNPVLFQPRHAPLLLFYKVGPSPSQWWGMLTTSTDRGRTWSKPRRLPDGILGPIRSKPVQLKDGTLLCPSSTEHAGWQVHMETSNDLGKTAWRTSPIPGSASASNTW